MTHDEYKEQMLQREKDLSREELRALLELEARSMDIARKVTSAHIGNESLLRELEMAQNLNKIIAHSFATLDEHNRRVMFECAILRMVTVILLTLLIIVSWSHYAK